MTIHGLFDTNTKEKKASTSQERPPLTGARQKALAIPPFSSPFPSLVRTMIGCIALWMIGKKSSITLHQEQLYTRFSRLNIIMAHMERPFLMNPIPYLDRFSRFERSAGAQRIWYAIVCIFTPSEQSLQQREIPQIVFCAESFAYLCSKYRHSTTAASTTLTPNTPAIIPNVSGVQISMISTPR